jgi:hypothetical protein
MAREMTFAMASPTSTDVSFTDACRRNLCKVKTLSFEKKSYECNVVDKLEIVSATRSDKSRGKVVMKYSLMSLPTTLTIRATFMAGLLPLG